MHPFLAELSDLVTAELAASAEGRSLLSVQEIEDLLTLADQIDRDMADEERADDAAA